MSDRELIPRHEVFEGIWRSPAQLQIGFASGQPFGAGSPVSVFPHARTKDVMTTILVNQTKPVIITASSLCVGMWETPIRSWLFLLLPILAGSIL